MTTFRIHFFGGTKLEIAADNPQAAIAAACKKANAKPGDVQKIKRVKK